MCRGQGGAHCGQQNDSSLRHLTGIRIEVRKWITRMLPKILVAVLFASSVPQFQLRDTQGASHAATEWASKKAVVLYFITVDCPVGNSYVPEMNRMREA